MLRGEKKRTALLTADAVRFIQIEHALRSGGANFARLRGTLGVSAATLKRDLKAMREELGAPIRYDKEHEQYCLAAPWSGLRSCLLELFR
jgi:predicted DNA-binding transcriptional regulator YafY